ncbi:guanylate cyclase [Planktothricoides sp. SR001]|uniref:response regulator n=1 Tax=Planktothricoides sp. SR001 TaxID=1705388 RepID=UPI0006C3BDCB|nr:response regulator [Planktothricoides sp. SR001]KOR35025.1 guanylate cyclase [Planktothricoides sp. SR001]
MSPLILLVDDDPTNLLLLEELLGSEGYHTCSANSGMEALEISGTQVPDLILLDVMMPDMDGFEVCRRLRENPQLQSTRIIFLTALDDEASQIQGLESLADAYFTKPISSNLLLAKISSLLQLQAIREKQQAEKVKPQFDLAWSVNAELIEKFRLFVPEQFLCRIAPEGVDSIRLGNALEEELTVLFCDIRGFTALAESQEALATYEWLNAFFSQMSEAIAANYGFIDKYLGDAIMAVFDRPVFHGIDGTNAAVAMAYSLQNFNLNRHQFNLEHPLKIGMGIHTGKAVIGTIGSNSRMDSTVIGDAVNTASRLEELTKIYSCEVIVSEAVINQIFQSGLAETVYVRSLDCLVLRGKTNSMKIYELLGNHHVIVDALKVKNKALFEAAIKFWLAQDFPQSMVIFEQVLQENPQDAIAEFYLQRCREQLT